MLAKWKINGLDGFVFGEDKKLYRMPYTNKDRAYGLREIKKQYPSRYKIGDGWLSERQMKRRIEIIEPFELFKDKELPF